MSPYWTSQDRWFTLLSCTVQTRRVHSVRSDHPDVDIVGLVRSFDSTIANDNHHKSLRLVMESTTKAQHERNRPVTGMCKPTIFTGFSAPSILGVPGCFAGDVMHLAALNVPDLAVSLLRGTVSCDRTDPARNWPWVVLSDPRTWQEHGREVASMRQHIPGSFERPPRIIAEKMDSGYKARKILLCMHGLAPVLLFGQTCTGGTLASWCEGSGSCCKKKYPLMRRSGRDDSRILRWL